MFERAACKLHPRAAKVHAQLVQMSPPDFVQRYGARAAGLLGQPELIYKAHQLLHSGDGPEVLLATCIASRCCSCVVVLGAHKERWWQLLRGCIECSVAASRAASSNGDCSSLYQGIC